MRGRKHHPYQDVTNINGSHLIPMRGRKPCRACSECKHWCCRISSPCGDGNWYSEVAVARDSVVASHPHAGTETTQDWCDYQTVYRRISSPCGDGNRWKFVIIMQPPSSHLIPMRGRKRFLADTVDDDIQSHLIPMRGRKRQAWIHTQY